MNGCDTVSPINAQEMRKELAIVRDKVNTLVDNLDVIKLNERQLTRQTVPCVDITTSTGRVDGGNAVTEAAISVFDPLKPSTDYSTVTTTVTPMPIQTTNSVPQVGTSATSNTGSGNASHLFPASSFLDPTQPHQPQTQYAQPTAPPPSSTPQPSQPNTFPYPPNPPTVQTSQPNNYTAGPGTYYPSQYQQPISSASPYPSPQGPSQQPQQANVSYAPYGPGMYQPSSTYPQGQPTAVGRGFTAASTRNSPYRVGY